MEIKSDAGNVLALDKLCGYAAFHCRKNCLPELPFLREQAG